MSMTNPTRPTDGISGRRKAGLVLLGLILLTGIGGLSYWILTRMDRIEQRLVSFDESVARVGGQVDLAIELATQAAESSDEARMRAADSEANAREAARTRIVAEEARAVAEADLEVAQAVAAAAEREAERARQEAERVERERQAELDRMQEALSRIVETRRTALGLVMDLGTDSIEFEFDRADLGQGDRELLSRIAGVLLTSTGYSVYVYGHTDDVGSADYNQRLSERRAQSVRDYLVEAGISPGIITTLGYGKSSPRVEGTSAAARSRNRRVEIGIVDVQLDYQGQAPDR